MNNIMISRPVCKSVLEPMISITLLSHGMLRWPAIFLAISRNLKSRNPMTLKNAPKNALNPSNKALKSATTALFK